MNINYLLLAFVLAKSMTAFAQPVPIEVMAGNENYWYQHSITRQFSPQSKFGFFHVSSLQLLYDDHKGDEIMSQSYLTYRLSRGINLAAGSFYATGPGFSSALAIQLMKISHNLLVLVVPRADLKKNASYEVMAIVEYRPMLTDKLGIYSRVQVMSNYGNYHNRSYQSFRAGLSVNKVQFGFGLNLDEYGKEIKIRHNLGLFIRTNL